MTNASPTLQLACELIRRRSVTPADDGCQALMISRLQALGFEVQHLRFGDVDNFWAVHGKDGPILAFAGHTDVVPTGPEAQWQHAPFEPIVQDGYLYGRGAADMKGSLAAMITAFMNAHSRASARAVAARRAPPAVSSENSAGAPAKSGWMSS